MVNKKRKISIYLILLILIINTFLIVADAEDGMWEAYADSRARAEVTDVKVLDITPSDFIKGKEEVIVRVTHGVHTGREFTIENVHTGNPAYDMYLKPGDQVVLLLELTEGEISAAYIEDYYRLNVVYLLVAVFAVLIILIGGWKGVRSLLTLIITIILVWWVLVPYTLHGGNPILISVGVSVIAIICTFFIVGGINKKSITAIIGTAGGIVLSGVLATVFSNMGMLTGMSMDEAQMLTFAPQQIAYNFRGLLLSGIIIGALGAVMDIGMSIASSMFEVKQQAPHLGIRELFQAGLNVGRDVMGTMVNTLILAYAGTSLPLLMLFRAYEMPLMRVFNMDLVVSEVVRSLAGSIGLICCIPLTALIAAVIYTRRDEA